MVGDGVEILCTDKIEIEVKHTERTHSTSSNCVLCIFLI